MASLAPLESVRIGSNDAVFDAGSSDPSAVTTTLSDDPVSFMPYFVLTNVFEAPESNMCLFVVPFCVSTGVPTDGTLLILLLGQCQWLWRLICCAEYCQEVEEQVQ